MDTLGGDCLNNVKNSEMIEDVLTVTDCSINSVKINALVQSKVDCKKLELSDMKCFKMHLGQENINCPSLKVNNKEMLSSEKERYLGDVISSDARIDQIFR